MDLCRKITGIFFGICGLVSCAIELGNVRLSSCLLILFFVACSKSDNEASFDCCTEEPILEKVGNGTIYVPTAFTPNSDRINDALAFFTMGDFRIDRFEILLDDRIVFETGPIDIVDEKRTYVEWDGMVDGEIKSRKYSVIVKFLDLDGKKQTKKTSVCAIICDPSNPKPIRFSSILNCTFGTQHDGFGGIDPSLPLNEDLECLD